MGEGKHPQLSREAFGSCTEGRAWLFPDFEGRGGGGGDQEEQALGNEGKKRRITTAAVDATSRLPPSRLPLPSTTTRGPTAVGQRAGGKKKGDTMYVNVLIHI